MNAACRYLLALSLAFATAGASGQDDPVPESEELPPPPPKDSPEPPSVPPVPDPRVRQSTPTPAELTAPGRESPSADRAAPGGATGADGSPRGPWWRQPDVVERLGVTREQASRLDRALEQFVTARSEATGEMARTRRSLLGILGGAEQGDPAEALDAWASTQHAMVDARAAFLRTVVDTLDSSQLETLARLAPWALVPEGRATGGEPPRRRPDR